MKRAILVLLAAAGLLAACGSDDNGTNPNQLTFQGNGNPADGAVFNVAHAGQTVRAALLDAGQVLDVQKTTVAASGIDPAFSVTFAPAIDLAKPYTVHYWIDSNFGDPTGEDRCDAPATDHQWSVAIPAGVTTFKDVHLPASVTDVCDTFTFPLTFVADGTFTVPHHDQGFGAALVRGAEATALDTQTGTVAAAGTDPALSVTFGPKLVIGEAYSVKLWIDFDGSGACEAPPTDHQWSVDIPTSLGSPHTYVYGPHNTGFTNVCSFFP